MKVKAMIRLILLMSLMAAMVVVARPAAASEELNMRWDILADFTGEGPDVNLVVEIGVFDKQGDWQQVDETTVQLECDAENVQWTGEGEPAIFNGEASVSCQMANIVDIANNMTGLEFPQWVGGSGSTIDTTLTVQGNWVDNPVFYHPQIQYATPVGTNAAKMVMEVGGLMAETDYFQVETAQEQHGEFGESGHPRQHFPAFSVDGTSVNASPSVLEGAASVDQTFEGTIYFGYSPATDSYFEGHLYTIDVDPGCIGMG